MQEEIKRERAAQAEVKPAEFRLTPEHLSRINPDLPDNHRLVEDLSRPDAFKKEKAWDGEKILIDADPQAKSLYEKYYVVDPDDPTKIGKADSFTPLTLVALKQRGIEFNPEDKDKLDSLKQISDAIRLLANRCKLDIHTVEGRGKTDVLKFITSSLDRMEIGVKKTEVAKVQVEATKTAEQKQPEEERIVTKMLAKVLSVDLDKLDADERRNFLYLALGPGAVTWIDEQIAKELSELRKKIESGKDKISQKEYVNRERHYMKVREIVVQRAREVDERLDRIILNKNKKATKDQKSLALDVKKHLLRRKKILLLRGKEDLETHPNGDDQYTFRLRRYEEQIKLLDTELAVVADKKREVLTLGKDVPDEALPDTIATQAKQIIEAVEPDKAQSSEDLQKIAEDPLGEMARLFESHSKDPEKKKALSDKLVKGGFLTEKDANTILAEMKKLDQAVALNERLDFGKKVGFGFVGIMFLFMYLAKKQSESQSHGGQ